MQLMKQHPPEKREKEKLYTLEEMSALLQVEKRTLVEWVQHRRIPYVKVNGDLIRFRVADIVEWVKGKRKESRQKFQIR